jgi:hypothetical protein
VEVEGVADAACYIDEFVDIKTGAENETLTPGGQFSISGHKIKIAGEDADIGVYFVSESGERVKADEPLAENTASKLIGVIPALGVGTWRVEIKTQYSGGSNFLKEPRTAALGVGLVVKEPA